MPDFGAGNGSSRPILLAEDNPFNQKVATVMLDRLGFRVDVASDGAEAVRAASGTLYGAILMDCNIPVLDGYDATMAIRRSGVSRAVPIIAVTASAEPADRARCFAAGMDDYITKPFSVNVLANVLFRCQVDGSDHAHRIAPGENDPANDGALDAGTVEGSTRLHEDGREDVMGQLALLFVTDADSRLVELREALAGDDRAAVALSAHTLNGASACLGATELASLCAALERSCAANGLQGVGVALDEIDAELGRVRAALGEPPRR